MWVICCNGVCGGNTWQCDRGDVVGPRGSMCARGGGGGAPDFLPLPGRPRRDLLYCKDLIETNTPK